MCDCGECVIVLWGEVKWVVEVGVFGCGGKALIVVICVYLIEAYTEWSIQITFYVLAIILYVISFITLSDWCFDAQGTGKSLLITVRIQFWVTIKASVIGDIT